MVDFKNHIVHTSFTLKDSLKKLNSIKDQKILFVVNDQNKLVGSITDGDLRRGLLNADSIDIKVEEIYQHSPTFVYQKKFDVKQLPFLREKGFSAVPILNDKNEIINILNFNSKKSYLPLDAVIMAGGMGTRLKPLTDNLPKPLLEVGGTPIIKYNLDSLINYGINDFWITVNYLKDKVIKYFDNDSLPKASFIKETKPLGTIGSLSLINEFKNDHILLTNSDILTNIDYEDFYIDFLNKNASISIVTIPYEITIPYGVVEAKTDKVRKIEEKPSYTYYSNAGIYLLDKKLVTAIPKNTFINATDFINTMILKGEKVIYYPFSGYWLDIGRHEDYERAQLEIKSIKF